MNNNKVTQIFKFSASWCGPCRVFADTFKKVSEMDEYKGIEFKSIDIENDEDGELMVEKYQIRSVPTTVLADENVMVIQDRVQGPVVDKIVNVQVDHVLASIGCRLPLRRIVSGAEHQIAVFVT